MKTSAVPLHSTNSFNTTRVSVRYLNVFRSFMSITPYATGAGRLDLLLNGAVTVGLLLITAPSQVWTFARSSTWSAALNAVICGYLLFAHVTGRGGRMSDGSGAGREGGGSGAGGNYLVLTVAYAALLLLAAPGLLRIF